MHDLAEMVHDYGYSGSSSPAELRTITSIVEFSDKVIVADRDNHCLRSFSYSTTFVETFAGVCTRRRNESDEQDQMAAKSFKTESVLFDQPQGMIKDQNNPDAIFVGDKSYLMKIFVIGKQITEVLIRQMPFHVFDLELNAGGDLVATGNHGVVKIDSKNHITWISGCLHNGMSSLPNTPTWRASYTRPHGCRFVTPDCLLVADYANNQLKLLNLTSQETYRIGKDISHPFLRTTKSAHYSDANISRPRSITMDDSYIYIGMSLGYDGSKGDGILKMAYLISEYDILLKI